MNQNLRFRREQISELAIPTPASLDYSQPVLLSHLSVTVDRPAAPGRNRWFRKRSPHKKIFKLFQTVILLAPRLQADGVGSIKKTRLKGSAMDSIKGIVIPSGWDSNGNIISLSIATGDEKEYIVENHQQISNLKDLLRQEVVVKGSIRDGQGYKMIKVANIRSEQRPPLKK
jgi:hypothetical protein